MNEQLNQISSKEKRRKIEEKRNKQTVQWPINTLTRQAKPLRYNTKKHRW